MRLIVCQQGRWDSTDSLSRRLNVMSGSTLAEDLSTVVSRVPPAVHGFGMLKPAVLHGERGISSTTPSLNYRSTTAHAQRLTAPSSKSADFLQLVFKLQNAMPDRRLSSAQSVSAPCFRAIELRWRQILTCSLSDPFCNMIINNCYIRWRLTSDLQLILAVSLPCS